MEKTVTLRFYDVERTSTDRPKFGDILEHIASLPIANREKRIGDEEILVRLENYAVDKGCACGQFVRGQSGNMPGQMLPKGTGTIPFTEPLGHGIAFRYRLADGLLAIQYDPRVLAPSRILQYLEAYDPRAEFDMDPRMRSDALERFEERPLRKLEVGVAGAPNLLDAERDDDSVWANTARMKRKYGADTIRFQISMGHRSGTLKETAKQVAREALQRVTGGDTDIRSIKGVIETGEGVPNEEVDLMGEIFDVKEDLSVPERDFAKFYDLRFKLLRTKIDLL